MSLKIIDSTKKKSEQLAEAIRSVEETQPDDFIFVYIDPADNRVVISAGPSKRTTLSQQLGMLEFAKLSIGINR